MPRSFGHRRSSKVPAHVIAWRELRNRWFADSALEESGFELSVPLARMSLDFRGGEGPSGRSERSKRTIRFNGGPAVREEDCAVFAVRAIDNAESEILVGAYRLTTGSGSSK